MIEGRVAGEVVGLDMIDVDRLLEPCTESSPVRSPDNLSLSSPFLWIKAIRL